MHMWLCDYGLFVQCMTLLMLSLSEMPGLNSILKVPFTRGTVVFLLASVIIDI